jgi:sulfate adenylyltransferase large subunit
MASDLLRFATIGSVDDGKSTLVGRLLVDTRQLFDDQLEAVATASQKRGVGDLDLSFVTDGLRAEREQGITIDVAYRYAATPERKFVIADCPGHVQYTANMATGASNADVALVVLDATAGLKEQTRRHLCIAGLLGVRHLIVAANKMDLVDWDEATFRAVETDVNDVARRLGFDAPIVVPVSALHGDNVVEPSHLNTWYSGPTVLQALNAAPAGAWASSNAGARLPIQWVLRQPGGGRTYAGMVNGSSLSVGQAVRLLPANVDTTIVAIRGPRGPLESAEPGLSVDVDIADDTSAGRGDVLATEPFPTVTREIEATVCWFADTPLVAGQRVRVKHTTHSTAAFIDTVASVVNIDALSLSPAEQLARNEIGHVTVTTADPLSVDDYRANRVGGSFVLIDEKTNATIAAGMIGHVVFA